VNLYLNFLAYLGVGVGLLAIGMLLFALSTPKINEFKLIAQKNVSASLLLGGKILGLALVLGSAAEYSVSIMDMIVWGFIGMLAQVIVFFLAEVITVRFSIQKAIEEDNRAIGTLLMSLSLAVGWIVAKCLTY
jgi:putative membrane protein